MRLGLITGFIIILVNVPVVVAGEPDVLVQALFRDKAMLLIDDERRLLHKGETTPEGVTLVEANSDHAVIEINNRRERYELGSQIGGAMSPPPLLPSVTLWPQQGMYQTSGSINGYSVDLLVDTGASTVAINAATARRLDIDFENAPPIMVRTASGTEIAYRVQLDQVQLGDIIQRNVSAVVIDGPEPERALLGMSFLRALDIDHRGDRLELRQKY